VWCEVVTDWNANAQITAQGFDVLGVEHAGSDHTEFKLTQHCVTKAVWNAILLVCQFLATRG
jgi:hypothetical protein